MPDIAIEITGNAQSGLAATREERQAIQALGEELMKTATAAQVAAAQELQRATQGMRFGTALQQVMQQGTQEVEKASVAHSKLHDVATKAFQNITKEVKNLAGEVLSFVTNPLKMLTSGLGVIGVAFGFDKLITDTMKWTQGIAKLTAEMNNDATSASALAFYFERFGINADQLNVRLSVMSQHVATNEKMFNQFGIATRDANNNLLPLLDIMLNTSAAMKGVGENSTLATELIVKMMSRSGQGSGAFVQAMKSLSDSFETAKQQGEQLGLVIDNTMLAKQVTAQQSLKGTQQVLHAVWLEIGQALLPVIADLGLKVGGWLVQNIDKLKNALAQATAFMLAFFDSLFGTNQATDQFTKSIAGATLVADDMAQGLGNVKDATTGASEAQKQATEATKDQIQAIDAEVRSLDDEKKAYDADAQARIRVIDLQIQQIDYARQQRDLARTVSDEKNKITQLETKLAQEQFDGNISAAQTTYQELLAERQKLSDSQQNVADDQQKHDLQLRKDAITNAKDAYDQMLNYRVQDLQKEKAAIQQAASDQMLAAQEAKNAIIDGMGQASNFTQGVARDMSDSARQVGHDWGAEMDSVDTSTSKAHQNGLLAAAELKEVFEGLAATLGFVAGMVGVITQAFQTLQFTVKTLDPTNPDWLQSLGDAGKAFGDAITKLYTQGRAAGGPVDANTPYLVGEKGPEIFMPRQQGFIIPNNAGSSGGSTPSTPSSGTRGVSGTNNITVNITSVGDPQETAQAVSRELASILNRAS